MFARSRMTELFVSAGTLEGTKRLRLIPGRPQRLRERERPRVAGIAAGVLGDDAARIRHLRYRPSRIARVIPDARVRARLPDDLTEAVAYVGRLRVERVQSS